MDEKIVMSLFAYFVIVIFVCSYTKMKYVNSLNYFSQSINFSSFDIFLFSTIITFFNVFCTNLSDNVYNWTGDRANYFYSYLYYREQTPGLECLYNIARFADVDFLLILYFTTFICCVITFWGLKKSNHFSLLALLFLFTTDYFFQSFAQLKQCYTSALCVVFFAFLLKERSIQRDLICVSMAIVASMFHTTGFILFPVFIGVRFLEKKKNSFGLAILCILLALFFFRPLMLLLANNLSSAVPFLASKISHYFFEENSDPSVGSFMTFVKGLPFYFITFFGLIRKRNYEKIIPNYSQYLFISFLASCLYLLSIASYWLFRFTTLFYVPIGIFFCQLLRHEKESSDKYFAILFVLGTSAIVKLRHDILLYINYGTII